MPLETEIIQLMCGQTVIALSSMFVPTTHNKSAQPRIRRETNIQHAWKYSSSHPFRATTAVAVGFAMHE